jgi:retinol dehydrogenase 14
MSIAVDDLFEGAAGAAGMALAFFTPFLRSWRDHWGLSPELAARPLPGDGVAGPGAYQWTHGVEIDAPADEVWPWVAQVGQGKAGFYSYQFLENLAGCAIENADRVHPEWANPTVGDVLRLHPDQLPLPVLEVEPGHHLLAGAGPSEAAGPGSPPPGLAVSWLFLVEPVDALRCRFISRFRLAAPAGQVGYAQALVEPVGFVMDRRMLLGVRERVPVEAPSLAQVGPLDLEGKTCLVTGANRGIGLASARWFARAGARVGLLCRDPLAAEAVRVALAEETGRPDVAEVVRIDLADRASVRAAATEILGRFPRIDVLLHNAGEFRRDRALSVDGDERMLAVGYLGPWLLTRLLEARLRASAPARVLVTAGMYHRRGRLDLDDPSFHQRPWDAMEANNQTQLARVCFAFELARRLAGTGVTVNAAHPGAVRTQAQDELTPWQRVLMAAVGPFVFVDPDEGALPNLRLAGERSLAGVTGEWFRGLHVGVASEAARDPVLAVRLWEWTGAHLG